MDTTAHTPDAVQSFVVAGQRLDLAIYTDGRGVREIDFVFGQAASAPRTAPAEQVIAQLEAYLDDPLRPFDLPLTMSGTNFQRRLWSALRAVPAGETETYGQLARRLNSGAQAVGQACRRNPVPIVVPCHRILSQSGMGGYAGEVTDEKLQIKLALLKHEGAVCG